MGDTARQLRELTQISGSEAEVLIQTETTRETCHSEHREESSWIIVSAAMRG
jgi:hypothetical protein